MGYLGVMYEEIKEQIMVVAIFKNGHTLPRMFCWHNRNYQVEQVNLIHEERRGNDLIFCFSVTASGNTYELSFDSQHLVWMLEKTWQ